MGQYGNPPSQTGGLYALIAIPLQQSGGCSHCGGGHGNEFHGTTKRPGYDTRGSLYDSLDNKVGSSRMPQNPQGRNGSYLDQKMDDPVNAFAAKHKVTEGVAAHYLAAQDHLRSSGISEDAMGTVLPGYFAILCQGAQQELKDHYKQLIVLAETLYGSKSTTAKKLH